MPPRSRQLLQNRNYLRVFCIVQGCREDHNHYYDDCIDGAVNVIVDFWGPGLKDQATALCRLVGEPNKKICYGILADAILFIFMTPEEAKPVCESFEEEYKNFCV